MTFAQARLAHTVRRPQGDAMWDAEMIRALPAHLGVNQAGLAEILGLRQQTISEWETGAHAPTRARPKHLTLVAERAGFPPATPDPRAKRPAPRPRRRS